MYWFGADHTTKYLNRRPSLQTASSFLLHLTSQNSQCPQSTWVWEESWEVCICAFPVIRTWRVGWAGCGEGAASWLGRGAGMGAFSCGVFTGIWSWVGVSTICDCCENCKVEERAVAGTVAGGSLAGSCGGGVCKLAAFCTGGPVEGSYCCWLCFCPVSCVAWGVGGIPPAK